MTAAIAVRGLGKRFNRHTGERAHTLKEVLLSGRLGARAETFWGLRDVTFDVAKGRTVGVVGRNGAGKSTLLRMIGGVGKPDEGTLETQGRIGALLDLGAGFTPDLTGRENVFIVGVIAGMTVRELNRRFDEIVAFAELEKFIDEPIRVYSTGMRMRLAFAVASFINPDILLLDEVLAVGDAPFQRKCLARIGQFKAAGCTIFLVSHDAASVRALCDEAIYLRDGRLVAHGPTDAVMDQYETPSAISDTRLSHVEVPDVQLAGGSLKLGVNRTGTQEVQIEKVSLLNLQGRPTRTVPSGSGLIVEIRFRARNGDTPFVIASVGINLPDGTPCFDTNTSLAEVRLRSGPEPATVRLAIDRLDLSGGEYFVDVGLYHPDWERSFDHHAQAYPLTVIGVTSGKGTLYPPFRWDMVDQAGSTRRAGPEQSAGLL